jgi:squalene-hopene/tetraprenyl-beta-curcumene cyclase
MIHADAIIAFVAALLPRAVSLQHVIASAANALFAVTALLLAAWMVAHLARTPIVRQRAIETTFALCLLIVPATLLPHTTPLTLNLLPTAADALRQAPSVVDNDLPNDGTLTSIKHDGLASRTPRIQEPSAASWRQNILLAIVIAVTVIFLIGALLAGAQVITGYTLLRRYRRAGIAPSADAIAWWQRIVPHRWWPALRRSAAIPRPIAFGIVHPHVLIPTWLDTPDHAAACSAILAHEAIHLRRRDALGWSLCTLLQPLLFFHPLYWSLRKTLRLAQDQIADAHAAALLGSPTHYAEALLQLARHLPASNRALQPLPALNALSRSDEFRARIIRLASPQWRAVSKLPRRSAIALTLSATLLASVCLSVTLNAGTPASGPTINPAAPLTAQARGVAYLRAHQSPDGSWFPDAGPSVTALVIKALLQSGTPTNDPAITRGLNALAQTHRPNGGFYTTGNPTYNTAIVLSTLAMFPHDRFASEIAAGHRFLQSRQPQPLTSWYTQTESPLENLSRNPKLKTGNSAFPQSSSLSPQSYSNSSEHSANDILPSYGQIAYAEFKSLLYAHLSPDDPRTRATLNWIRATYTLEQNPADDSHRGEFYYYHAFAKALRAADITTIRDARGHAHDWRTELQLHLAW